MQKTCYHFHWAGTRETGTDLGRDGLLLSHHPAGETGLVPLQNQRLKSSWLDSRLVTGEGLPGARSLAPWFPDFLFPLCL